MKGIEGRRRMDLEEKLMFKRRSKEKRDSFGQQVIVSGCGGVL